MFGIHIPTEITNLGYTPATMVPGSVGLWVGDQAILTNVHVPAKQGILGRLIRTEIEKIDDFTESI